MISKSDLIILVLASGALTIGIFRWHQNTQDVNAVTIPASASTTASNNRVVVETVENSALPTTTVTTSVADAKVVDSNAPVNRSIQTDADGQIVVKTIAQPEPVAGIVVESDTTPNFGSHLVQSGDYLSKIADQYGTDVQTLRNLNNISGSIIQIGQEILYPL